MYRKTILFILSLVSWATAWGQTYEYQPATSADDFTDEAKCIITATRSGGVCNLYFVKDNRGMQGNIYDFRHDKVYRDIDDMNGSTQTFTLKKHDGKYYLYVQEQQAYISVVDKTMTSNQALSYLFAFTPDAKDPVSIEIKNGINEIKIGNKYLQHHTTASYYRLVNNLSASYEPVVLYIEKEKKEAPILEINSETDLINTNFTGTIKFYRTFENNYYNTIVLPFTINDPWTVFGSGVVVYEPLNGTADELTFRKLKSGEKMTGYKPYIISGTFGSPPYIITNTSLNYKTIGSKLKTTAGSLTIHSVFQKTVMGRTSNYILYKNKFRNCKAITTLSIEPYKWYIMAPEKTNKTIKWAENIYLKLSH